MFTGIIQATGHIDTIVRAGDDIKLSIQAADLGLDDVQQGDSIAVNGVCLTATHLDKTHFEVHVSKETLNVSVGLNKQQTVNLEKALRLNDRLGGHLVSGHVDGVGEVTRFEDIGQANEESCWLLAIRAPHAISKYIAKKGSICVDGVSLTVNTIENDVFTMNIIPHTLQHTSFQYLTVGSQVNLEIDQIARYVERMAEWAQESTHAT
jgi:riboflavin synthase